MKLTLYYSPMVLWWFGAAYGAYIGLSECWFSTQMTGWQCILWSIVGLLLCVTVPALGFIQHSLHKHGHASTRPINKRL